MLFLNKFHIHIIAAVLIATLLIVLNSWREDSRQLDQVRKDFEVYKERIEQSERTKKEITDGLRSEVDRLREDIRNQPTPVVRLCPDTSVPNNRPAGGDNGPSPGAGSIQEGDGMHRDVGPELFNLANRADILSAQLRGCQSYINKLRTK